MPIGGWYPTVWDTIMNLKINNSSDCVLSCYNGIDIENTKIRIIRN